jgi:hypothetical protein
MHDKKIETLVKEGVNHPDINEENLDREALERLMGWIHNSHFTDNKLNDKCINDVTVDIGENKDWSISEYLEDCQITMEGDVHLDAITGQYYDDKNIHKNKTRIEIPKPKDGSKYSLKNHSKQQQAVVIASIDTIVKFLKNNKKYKPLQATVMGCGGAGKSFILNTIISIMRNMTQMNDTLKVGAPSGAAAYNVQGSTLHRLLGISVSRPKEKIDERSMLSSKVLAAAERNTRHSVYKGQNSGEIWGGVPVVLLYGDDYQLFPVIKEGAIQGYSKKKLKMPHTPTEKLSASQLLCQRGSYLFTNVMSETVFTLDKNYRVKNKEFHDLFGRLHTGEPTQQDAEIILNLHIGLYESDIASMDYLKNNKKTMWLYARNAEKELKNQEMLVYTSKKMSVPVARLDCTYDTKRLSGDKEQMLCYSHFDQNSYDQHTNICVGARVAISNVNFLPETGLYNGAIGDVFEIVYNDRPVGPNDKQHYHLPNYVVVNFPNL